MHATELTTRHRLSCPLAIHTAGLILVLSAGLAGLLTTPGGGNIFTAALLASVLASSARLATCVPALARVWAGQ